MLPASDHLFLCCDTIIHHFVEIIKYISIFYLNISFDRKRQPTKRVPRFFAAALPERISVVLVCLEQSGELLLERGLALVVSGHDAFLLVHDLVEEPHDDVVCRGLVDEGEVEERV